MQEDIKSIKARLQELAAAIAEVKRLLPAHSAKPLIMHQLLDLEDEYELLLKKLRTNTHETDPEPDSR